MATRPIDIARKLGISTTTLRTYEELDLIPTVSRSASGYRVYTEEHIAYFICVREMMGGFSLTDISKILKEVMEKKINSALWMANKAQADLHQEKIISRKIILNLGCIGEQEAKHPTSLCIGEMPINAKQEMLTINDVSRETGVPTTTIRYWDKVGLLSVERCKSNNYRMFTTEHIRQILTIYALKFSVYANRQKHSINRIKEELKEFNYEDRNRITSMINDIEQYLDNVNRAQISSISALYHLCIQQEKNHFDNQI